MSHFKLIFSIFAIALGAFFLALFAFIVPSSTTAHAIAYMEPAEAPLHFEKNLGQSSGEIDFMARLEGGTLMLGPSSATFSLRPPTHSADTLQTVRMNFFGSNQNAEGQGIDILPEKYHYYIGSNSKEWTRDVPTYKKIHYSKIYPGVDLVYHGDNKKLEYDFIVAPGADPAQIKIDFEGIERLTLDEAGNLLLMTSDGVLTEEKPIAYQVGTKGREVIASKFVLDEKGRVSFLVADYDQKRPLIIDPTLFWTYHLGGSNIDGTPFFIPMRHDFPQNRAFDLAISPDGYVYSVGIAGSSNFPNPTGNPTGGSYDAFVTKQNIFNQTIEWTVFIGGSGEEEATAIALGNDGNIYVTGKTNSSNFPTLLPSPTFTTLRGDSDIIIAKIAPDGTLICSGLAGSDYSDRSNDIAVDGDGNVYIGGMMSTAFPHFQGFVGKYHLPPNSPTLEMERYHAYNDPYLSEAFIGQLTQVNSLKLDSSGNVYVVGMTQPSSENVYDNNSGDFTLTPTPGIAATANAYQSSFRGYGPMLFDWYDVNNTKIYSDCFISILDPEFSPQADYVRPYFSYLGGAGFDSCNDIVLDASGNYYVVGTTSYPNDFPPNNNPPSSDPADLQDSEAAFVVKFDSSHGLVWSNMIDGDSSDLGIALSLFDNRLYVVGETESSNLPLDDPFQAQAGGQKDAFVFVYRDNGNVSFSSYLGADGNDSGQSIETALHPHSYANPIIMLGGTSDFTLPKEKNHHQGEMDHFLARINRTTITPAEIGQIEIRPQTDFVPGAEAQSHEQDKTPPKKPKSGKKPGKK